MAAVAGTRTAHATLTGTTVDTVTLAGHFRSVLVLNRDTESTDDVLWVTVSTDPRGTAPTTPVAAADETYPVLPGTSMVIDNANLASAQWRVSILGDGNAYSVIGIP